MGVSAEDERRRANENAPHHAIAHTTPTVPGPQRHRHTLTVTHVYTASTVALSLMERNLRRDASAKRAVPTHVTHRVRDIHTAQPGNHFV